MKWEYTWTRFRYNDATDEDGVQDMLDSHGEAGWEAVGLVDNVILFKRSKKEPRYSEL